MTHLLAFSVGDQGSATSIGNLPYSINHLVNDPNILSNILGTLFNLLFFAAAFLVFVFTVYHAWRWVVSQGDKKNIETARSAFWNGILGLIIVLTAFLIVNILGFFFHAHLLQTCFLPAICNY